MRPAAMEKVGVLVLRVWIEPTQARRLRARLTHSLDVSGSDTEVSAAAGVEEISGYVHRWLNDFIDSASAPRDSMPKRDD
jgi:hypothetical protein